MRTPIILLILGGLGLMGLGTSVHAQDCCGTFGVAAPEGMMQLTLREHPDDVVVGTLRAQDVTFQVDGMVIVDAEGEWSVEGVLTGPQGRGEFAFYPDDEGGYLLLLTPYDAAGTLRLDLAAEYAAQRTEAAAPGPESLEEQPPPDGTTRDPRLVGVWTTQVSMLSPQGTIVTELSMEIRADGMLVDGGARSMAGFPGAGMDTGQGQAGETLGWRTRGNVLLVSYEGSAWVPMAQYEVAGNRLLLLFGDGSRQLWHRR